MPGDPMTSAAQQPPISESHIGGSATHIRLVCWDRKHEQSWSAVQLRSAVVAPICTAAWGDGICGQPIWAVKHGGEPTRYVGRPPHQRWDSWADCVGAP